MHYWLQTHSIAGTDGDKQTWAALVLETYSAYMIEHTAKADGSDKDIESFNGAIPF